VLARCLLHCVWVPLIVSHLHSTTTQLHCICTALLSTEVVGISAKLGTGVPWLLYTVLQHVHPGPMYYPRDYVADRNERFLATEIVRECLLELYHVSNTMCSIVCVNVRCINWCSLHNMWRVSCAFCVYLCFLAHNMTYLIHDAHPQTCQLGCCLFSYVLFLPFMQEEIPYSCEVVMENFEDKNDDFSVLSAAVSNCALSVWCILYAVCCMLNVIWLVSCASA